MGPVEAKTVADFLVAGFEREAETTVRVFEAVPSGQLGYRPDSKGRTGLGLLRHIALEDPWLLTCIAEGTFTPPPDDSDACGVMGPADAIARYRRNLPPALARIRAMSGERLAGTLTLFGTITMPPVAFLAMALKHSVHHRGQLSSYLRAMGGKVPSIYGPTADTEQPTTGAHEQPTA